MVSEVNLDGGTDSAAEVDVDVDREIGGQNSGPRRRRCRIW
jgi:hypothetical protein